MEITYKMALEVATHEAIIRQAYKDSVGVWTWSIGLTNASGHNVERYIGNPQSLQKCLDVFVWALQKYAKEVEEAFGSVKLTEAQKAAALSFHWNTGAIKTADWVKSYKRGNVAAARKEIMNWKTPASIIPRREKERDLFFDGKWTQSPTIVEYTKLKANSTPDWSSAKKINISKELEAALGTSANETKWQTSPSGAGQGSIVTEKPVQSVSDKKATNLLEVIFELLRSIFKGGQK